MPRLVRRQPLAQRIQSYLNPADLLLWLSEEFESHGWDQLEKESAIPVGVALNIVFLIARANSQARSSTGGYEDVFGDGNRKKGWFGWLASFVLHFLTLLSFANAAYTFWRKRHYRLFEVSIDAVPSTPSARRVRVDSSPMSSSPLKFLSTILGADQARSRAHADPQRDVWQLAVWDPLPTCLRLFCYFSPGHVLIYWLFLPTAIADPRPSVTIMTAMLVCLLLSIQLSALHSRFSQQSKDSALISKETLHEYDTKFVHPRTQPRYRDVGTQFSEQASYNTSRDMKYNFVETYTPAVVINRSFKTNPNPNYSKHTDPDSVNQDRTTSFSTPNLSRSSTQPQLRTPARAQDSSSPIRPNTAIRQPQQYRPGADIQSSSRVGGGAGGGSLGVYSHADSPLKKQASFPSGLNTTSSDLRTGHPTSQPIHRRERNSLSPEKQLLQQQQWPTPSPAKRISVPASGLNTLAASKRWSHLQTATNTKANTTNTTTTTNAINNNTPPYY